MKLIFTFAICCCFKLSSAWSPGDSQPHIIYVLADDLGYNDVSYNNDAIVSDKIKELAEDGIILDRFYVQPSCSPSRSALMSGYYPIHNGFNEGPLGWAKKAGLESQYTTIAERLTDDFGYESHMVGKWHLGYCNETYLPHNRGFKTFHGIWHSGTDHWTYKDETFDAYDLHRNDEIDLDNEGTYSSLLYAQDVEDIIAAHDSETPLFLYVALQDIHTPLDPPDDYLLKYRGAGLTGKRKKASAMVSIVDDAITQIMDALAANNDMLDNTILVFSSDNGGQPTVGGANNLPLRGGKNTWFEGGLRVPAFVYSKLFDGLITPGINSCMMHITDMYTTMLTWAGNTDDVGVDGVDQWSTLLNGGSTCVRSDLIHNIITNRTGSITSASYREGDYKLMIGDVGDITGWVDTSQEETDGETADIYLFNVNTDPEETENLAYDSEYSDLVDSMTETIEEYAEGMVEFATTGRCIEDDVIDENDNAWLTGCCNI